MSESPLSASPASQISDMPGVYTLWRNRVHGWIARHSRAELADAIFLVPDLLALVIRLLSDPRTPLFFKGQLILVAVYMFSPIDFVPEAVLGAAGLADDAVIASVVLLRLIQHATQIDRKLVNELWPGQGDIVSAMEEIVANGGELVNTRVWNRIRTLFGSPSPDPAMVDPRGEHVQN